MARRVQKDWYQILQVHPEADPETIQAAYRSLLRRCHPDKNPDRRAWAEQRTRELNEAYAVLSNAERRREFDALRARWGAGAFGTPRTIRTPGATAAGLGADAGYSLLFRENRRLEAQVARLQGEKAQLEAELVRTRTELQELQKRVEDLRRRLEESDGQRRRLEQALAVANKQRQLLQERLDRPRSAPSGEGLSTRNRRIASKRTISLPGDRVTVTFVWIPGGSFTMGCAVGSEDESPEHTVELDGFWMSQTPITCRQFAEFVRQQPAWSKRLRAPDRHPDYLRDFLDDTPPSRPREHAGHLGNLVCRCGLLRVGRIPASHRGTVGVRCQGGRKPALRHDQRGAFATAGQLRRKGRRSDAGPALSSQPL